VRAIAVHPDHLRRGHGRHLLTSLSAKLAILGPPRLVAEVPADDAAVLALLLACGWREERRCHDLLYRVEGTVEAPSAPVRPVTVDELGEGRLLPAAEPRAWERSRATLLARKDRLRGLAWGPAGRIEAYVLYTLEAEGAMIWNQSPTGEAADAAATGELLRCLALSEGVPV